MAAGYWGADVGELRALAKDFDQKAAQLTTIAGTLNGSINATTAWKGPDAVEFRSEWNGTYRQSLTNATNILRAASTALVKNADEQETASTDGGAFGGGGPGGPGGNGPGGNGGDGSGGDGSGGDGGTPTVPGLTDDENNLLQDLLEGGYDLATNLYDSAAVVDLLNRLQQLRLLGSFSSLDAALDFRAFANGFNSFNDFLGGQNWGSLTQGLSNLLGDGAMASRVGSAAEFLGAAGKWVGPVGAVLGVVTVGVDVAEGNYGRAGYDAVSTGLGIAAMVTPPPANLALGIAAGGMALGGLLYDNVPAFHNAVDATGEAIGDAAEATGEFLGDAGEAIADGASDFAEGVADVAEDLWPF
ncbi:WXG100 family type VII secretion target [Herbiconiux sp. YIM B11900]|uniref:WXG100 family type VII secretion target n=1 Tax=Herbiconiux sp. YIM B11900 TaxID=3404131 RepID=UPI003F867032